MTKTRRLINTTAGIWIAGSVLSCLALIPLIPYVIHFPVIFGVLFVITLGQAVVAIPAALSLRHGKRWARYLLIVLAFFSLGSLYQAIDMESWASVGLNVALGATAPLLLHRGVAAEFRAPHTTQPDPR